MYSYPIDFSLFTKEEVVKIIEFLSMIEDINEKKNSGEALGYKYNEYRKIINSKALEKEIDRDFLKASGYSIYKTMKKHI